MKNLLYNKSMDTTPFQVIGCKELIVDPCGDDTLATREGHVFYATQMKARDHAQFGDLITSNAGTYVNQHTLTKDGVTYKYKMGAKIRNTVEKSVYQKLANTTCNVVGYLDVKVESLTKGKHSFDVMEGQNMYIEVYKNDNLNGFNLRTRKGCGNVYYKVHEQICYHSANIYLGGYKTGGRIEVYADKSILRHDDLRSVIPISGKFGSIRIAQTQDVYISEGVYISEVVGVPALNEQNVGYNVNGHTEVNNCSFISNSDYVCTHSGVRDALNETIYSGSTKIYNINPSGLSISYTTPNNGQKYYMLGSIISNVPQGGTNFVNLSLSNIISAGDYFILDPSFSIKNP